MRSDRGALIKAVGLFNSTVCLSLTSYSLRVGLSTGHTGELVK